jgi:two-component system sensor histidine kinase DegS
MIVNVSILDGVISKTVEAVEKSIEQIFDIAESARKESHLLRHEVVMVKQELSELIRQVDEWERVYRKARERLALVSREFQTYSEEDIKEAYEHANHVQVNLLLAREKEKNLIKRRDELERRLRNIEETIAKAENLVTQMGVVLGYLKGDLGKVEEALENAKQHQQMGLRILQAQEEERKRVAREIHDGPAQSMANVVLRSDIVEKMLRNNQIIEALMELEALKEMVRNSLADVRRIIFDLRPMALDDLGLIPALQKYIQTVQERSKLNIELIVFGREQELDESGKAALFRLVQECLNNIIKHAEAKFVKVKVQFLPEGTSIVVSDDGKGFRMEEIEKRGNSFGILGMKERVQLLHGKMDIISAPKQGTKVIFQISVKL